MGGADGRAAVHGADRRGPARRRPFAVRSRCRVRDDVGRAALRRQRARRRARARGDRDARRDRVRGDPLVAGLRDDFGRTAVDGQHGHRQEADAAAVAVVADLDLGRAGRHAAGKEAALERRGGSRGLRGPGLGTAVNATKPRPGPVVHWPPACCASPIACCGVTTVNGTVVAFTYGVPTYDRVSTVAAEPLPLPGISTKPGTGALFVVSVNV